MNPLKDPVDPGVHGEGFPTQCFPLLWLHERHRSLHGSMPTSPLLSFALGVLRKYPHVPSMVPDASQLERFGVKGPNIPTPCFLCMARPFELLPTGMLASLVYDSK